MLIYFGSSICIQNCLGVLILMRLELAVDCGYLKCTFLLPLDLFYFRPGLFFLFFFFFSCLHVWLLAFQICFCLVLSSLGLIRVHLNDVCAFMGPAVFSSVGSFTFSSGFFPPILVRRAGRQDRHHLTRLNHSVWFVYYSSVMPCWRIWMPDSSALRFTRLFYSRRRLLRLSLLLKYESDSYIETRWWSFGVDELE